MKLFLKYTFSFILIAFKLSSQDFNDDAALWTNIYLEKRISSKIDLHLNQQNRINNNISEFGQGYADIGLTYNLNKKFKLLLDYVLIERKQFDDSYSTRHQFYTALMFKQKYKRWLFSYRNMIQVQFKDYFTSYYGGIPTIIERNKFTVKYELNKRLSFYLAEELYLPFDQSRNKGLNRSRSFLGSFYKLSKKLELELYFALQKELNSFNETDRIFIYGIGLSRNF